MTPEQRRYILSLDRDGQLTPDDVVAAAAPPSSPIHNLFLWDDAAAGHRYRIEQAREVITRVRVNYITREAAVREICVAEYIRDPEMAPQQQGYVRTAVLRTRDDSARAALRAELDRVEAMVRRARNVAAGLGLDSECEAGLRVIMRARKAPVVAFK